MSDYLVRASALTGVHATIEDLGGDADAILQRLGLSRFEEDPDAWISYSSFLLLLEHASRETGCPHFGLRLSARQDVGILGALGFVIQQAPDLRTALRELITRFAFHNQGAYVSLEVDNGLAAWRFNCKLDGEFPTRQQEDLVAGIGLDLMRLLWRPDWAPRAVCFTHAQPDDIRPYRERFRCPLQFNWDSNMMTFDAAILNTPIDRANPQLHRLLESYLDGLQLAHPDDFIGKVRFLIQQAMYTGDCSIDRVAARLAINKRTLQRRLKSEGSSFKALQDDVRFNTACKYLRESNGSVSALAEMLCYSDISAFSNAFTQRFGVSPRRWKKQQSTRISP
jgi:AraC-like DNA-binding protein